MVRRRRHRALLVVCVGDRRRLAVRAWVGSGWTTSTPSCACERRRHEIGRSRLAGSRSPTRRACDGTNGGLLRRVAVGVPGAAPPIVCVRVLLSVMCRSDLGVVFVQVDGARPRRSGAEVLHLGVWWQPQGHRVDRGCKVSARVMRCAMRCDAMRCDAMRCDAMRCDAMRCDAMRCDAMRCDAMRCSAVPCRADHNAVYRFLSQGACGTQGGAIPDCIRAAGGHVGAPDVHDGGGAAAASVAVYLVHSLTCVCVCRCAVLASCSRWTSLWAGSRPCCQCPV